VQKVEFLADGSLGVRLRNQEFYGGHDAAVLEPGGQAVEVPYKDFEPEAYRASLREAARGVDFLRTAPAEEVERFFEDPSWLRQEGRWLRHESCAGPDPKKATVFLGEDRPQAWIYDRE